MSFTLIRYKDGKEIPIKISILDAFRSAPRRPKAVLPQKEPDNKPHEVKVASPEASSTNAAKDDDNKTKNFLEHEQESYSAEDDAKIVAMKDEKKSWKQIKEAIGKKSESQLKNHYRLHLGPRAEEEQKKLAEKIAKAELNKAEGFAKQAEGQAKKDGGGGEGGKKKAGGVGGASGGADGDDGQSVETKGQAKEKAEEKTEEKEKKAEEKAKKSKDKDTPQNLTRKNLQNFVKKYEKDKWLAAASRHYDLTGQRISPEAAKTMADQK